MDQFADMAWREGRTTDNMHKGDWRRVKMTRLAGNYLCLYQKRDQRLIIIVIVIVIIFVIITREELLKVEIN